MNEKWLVNNDTIKLLIMNLYESNNMLKYIKQELLKIKGKMDKTAIIIGN